MKYRVLRGGKRIPGWGALPDPGKEIEAPKRLGRQLVAQGLVEPVKAEKTPANAGTEQETD